MNELSIEKRPVQSLESRDPESILRFAIEQKADVEVIERLMAVRRELMAERAKQAYDAAMAEFQSDCPVIVKEKGVPDRSGSTAFKFAPIEAIQAQIKPFEKKHGFSHTFPETQVEAGWITAVCRVTHQAGHSEPTKVKYPIGTKTAIMSDTQQYAATETFCKRRALCNAYGIIISGEDIDGQTGKLKTRGPNLMRPDDTGLKPLAESLWALLTPVRGDKRNWDQANQWLWKNELLDAAIPEAAPNLSAERFKQVIDGARKALAR